MLKRLRKILAGRDATPSEPDTPRRDDDRITDPLPEIHHGPKVVHSPIPLSDIDPDAVKILRRLTRFNHTAYLVGGCVRDLLLDRHPKDFDIGTTATPRQVKRLFSNCRIIGRRFRLAHIYFQNGKIIEVATFRARDLEDDSAAAGSDDGDLLIRDDNIFGTPEEDAIRRDFTINALFYDVNNETVLDHTDGLGDLRRRVIRTIGDPEIRFREDPIRILRAIKFAARLDFEIEPETREALDRTRNLIPKAASSRVLEEINRFCRGGAARKSFDLLRESGVFEVILPGFAEGYHEDPVAWDYLRDLLDALDRRWAAGHEISTGEILVVLLLPLLSRRMGWQEDGIVQRKRGTNVRELADGMLRPMALRLRVARRDQEHCRQSLLTMYRMVPARNVRRSTKRALAERPCMADCLWILEAVAGRLGGDFRESFREWSASTPAPQRATRGRSRPTGDGSGDTGPDGTSRRRRRPRRSRRRAAGRGTEASRSRPPSGDAAEANSSASAGKAASRPASKPASKPTSKSSDKSRAKPTKKPPKDGMPPPWDDGYFFAALPSVPETSVGDRTGDRYGSSSLTGPERTTGDGSPEDGDSDRPARPRRRRRRRRGRSRNAGEAGGDGGSSDSGGKGDAPDS